MNNDDDEVRIYCGDATQVPAGYGRRGTPYECLTCGYGSAMMRFKWAPASDDPQPPPRVRQGCYRKMKDDEDDDEEDEDEEDESEEDESEEDESEEDESDEDESDEDDDVFVTISRRRPQTRGRRRSSRISRRRSRGGTDEMYARLQREHAQAIQADVDIIHRMIMMKIDDLLRERSKKLNEAETPRRDSEISELNEDIQTLTQVAQDLMKEE
jgi:hypothetical protein